MGLREAKKALTRKHISNVARDLFIKKGYDSVTVTEVAASAEMAVATVFNYFPTKESLIFDRDEEIEAELISALRERKKNQSILDCLHCHFAASQLINPSNKKIHSDFMRLIRSSPALSSFYRGLWSRYEKTLAKEIQRSTRDSNSSQLEAECIARFVLEAVSFACDSSAPLEALHLSFKLLKGGSKI